MIGGPAVVAAAVGFPPLSAADGERPRPRRSAPRPVARGRRDDRRWLERRM